MNTIDDMQNEMDFYDYCNEFECNHDYVKLMKHSYIYKHEYIHLYEYLYFGIHTRIRVDILCVRVFLFMNKFIILQFFTVCFIISI